MNTNRTYLLSLRVEVWSLVLAALWALGSIQAAEILTDKKAAPVTTADPEIDLNHLKWLLKPLTQEELVVEADGWRDLLKAKVREIGDGEISNKQKNRQIEETEAAAKAVEQAEEAMAEAEEATEIVEEAQAQAAEKASQEAEKAAKAAEEAAAKAAEEAEKATAEAAEAAAKASNQTVAVIGTNQEAAEIKRIAEAEAEAKKLILETLAVLREERAALIERLDVVLGELKAKGGEVAAYEKYRDAVSEVIVDVSDTSAVWAFLTGWLTSDKGGMKWASNIVKFLVILAIFIALAKLIGKTTDKATAKSKTMSVLLKHFIQVSVRRLVVLIGLLGAVSVMGIPVGPLLAVITAAGFVIGLALQGTLSNFASGLLLLFYRPFDVGDAVEAGGVSGIVGDMNLMSTQIKTWDNKSMIVPNNSIWGSVITNISRTERRRVDMVFGIGYADSMEKAQKILDRIVAAHPKVMKDPAPTVKVHELGDSSVNFVVRPWVVPADYWSVYWDITRQVKEAFDKEGVSIPFPQRDVHLYKTGE